jgi:membrane associated rhomboid family serine protease
VSGRPRRQKIDWSQVRITRGALIVLGLQVGMSLVWLLADLEAKATLGELIVASKSQVFERFRVWTLVTSPLLEIDFLALLLSAMMLWMFVPTLERFWGTPRFFRFVAITSVVGTTAGCLMGLATGNDFPIVGLSPFTYASVVAFGLIYARQPVQFFGVLPLTGRQMMFGFIAFLVLFIGLQGLWEKGAAFAAAMLTAAIMTSKKWSPGLAFKRWRIARARAKFTVLEGGATIKPPVGKRDEQRWLN